MLLFFLGEMPPEFILSMIHSKLVIHTILQNNKNLDLNGIIFMTGLLSNETHIPSLSEMDKFTTFNLPV